MTKRGNYRSGQRGATLAAMALLIAMVTGGLVLDWTLAQSQQQLKAMEHEQSSYLAALEGVLVHWYTLNMHTVDAVGEAPDLRRILREAGVAERWNLQLSASQRLERDGVRYRVIALWLPQGTEDTTRLDPSSGAFSVSARTPNRLINGHSIQTLAVAETRTRMQKIAERLEARATAQYLLDPSRDINRNRFRPVNCATPLANDLPCIDRYQTLEAIGIAQNLGVEARLTRDAWGGNIELSNGLDSQTVEPPFSMALRAVTPWGAFIRVTAVQAL